ncbi:RagB/SusD family nutrient uptake outer membrane protein [Rhodohalobacter sp. 614A]|uniref:RagB/SusD family nutrient uptake outer membrane protein n=1 Tax=Rhodohalobacter sp. 614A TaxID=2908649 RepID=UPI001F3425F2|nr:RagB/SusD family nutrient uptake outer membrane protein [Rhodohalobacter sp. 614A]
MKNQKYTYIVAPIIIAVLLFYGCEDFLSVPAKGSLGEEVLANTQGVETSLLGAYAALDGAGLGYNAWETSPHNWVYGSVVGGDAHKGSEPADQAPINEMMAGNFIPTSSFFNNKWKALYEGISRANATLSLLEQVEDMSEDQIARARGEARFLRGHYYFELRKMFNKVPWIDETTEDLNQPNDSEIWPNIEADFQYAFDNLPETHGERGRVNRWAAAAYLARTYVYQEKWNEAKSLYDQIIPNGVTSQGVSYDLANGFWDNWNPGMEDGLPEAVFSIEQVANDGTGGINNANFGMMLNFPQDASTFRCCGFYSPTQDLVNSYRTQDGLPLIDGYNNEIVKNDLGVTSSQQFDMYGGELDPRLDWTVGRRGVPYHDWGPFPGQRWVRDQNFGGPYYAKKNIYWKSQEAQYADNRSWAPGTAINIPVIRFADVLLMAAEAEVETGSLEQAQTYVNRVRERASRPESWVDNDLNRGFASAVVNNESEMLTTEVEAGEWVVREDTGTTFTFIGGDPGNISSWNEYSEPNYNISQYTIPWSDTNTAREAVRFERKLELAMEGHRFFDLVRWGVAQEVLSDFYIYEGSVFPGSEFANGQFRNEYYPIPQRQIDLSEGTLQQNLGY